MRRPFIALLLCIALLFPARPAKALGIGGAVVIAAVVTVTVLVAVVATSYHFLHKPTIKGCVSTGPNGLQLTDEYVQQVFQLTGNTADVKPGVTLKLQGKKQHSIFRVDTVKKDYGVCKVAPATP